MASAGHARVEVTGFDVSRIRASARVDAALSGQARPERSAISVSRHREAQLWSSAERVANVAGPESRRGHRGAARPAWLRGSLAQVVASSHAADMGATWSRQVTPQRHRLVVSLPFVLVLTVIGCAPSQHPLIERLCVSASGRLVAFDLMLPERPPAVSILRLADGKLVARVQEAGPVRAAGWTAEGERLYVLDRGKIELFDVATRRERPVAARLFTRRGARIRISDATHVTPLDIFIVRGQAPRSASALYAVHAKARTVDELVPGNVIVNAMRTLHDKRSIAIVTSERFDTQEPPSPGITGRLTLYHYPPGKPPMTFLLPVGRGVTGLGDVTSDGTTVVLPYRDYLPSRPARSHVYVVNLISRAVVRQAAVAGGVVVTRIGTGDSFLVTGPGTFATVDLKHFRLRPIPGGPVGTPSSLTITKDMQVVIAVYPEAEIQVLDIATGKRRVLWRQAR